MLDDTEGMRKDLQAEINAVAAERAALKARHGQIWSTSELTDDFDVLGFGAPFVIVRRKSDGTKGSLAFQHSPRYYFDFTPA